MKTILIAIGALLLYEMTQTPSAASTQGQTAGAGTAGNKNVDAANRRFAEFDRQSPDQVLSGRVFDNSSRPGGYGPAEYGAAWAARQADDLANWMDTIELAGYPHITGTIGV